MIRVAFVGLLFSFFLKVGAQSFVLPYEKENFNSTLDYFSMIKLCRWVDNSFDEVRYAPFGFSAQGDTLPMLVIGRIDALTKESCRQKNKLVVLIEAGIHPGEPEGVEAGFLLLRDLMDKKSMNSVLDRITILFIPSFNVDGLKRFGAYNRINQNGPKEMGWRTTAQNLNLNRDFLKADAPEMRAWLKIYHEWYPDFMIDCHTTDGADYQYVMTYGLDIPEYWQNGLGSLLSDDYIPQITSKMREQKMKIFPYVTFRKWHDPRSGLFSYPSSPMLSHGYTLLVDRPCLLLETHMLKAYKPRVESTKEMIWQTLVFLNDNASKYKEMLHQCDENRLSLKGGDTVVLSNKTALDTVLVDFEGFAYDIIKSDVTGGDWFQYHPQKPETMKLAWNNKIIPDKKIVLPYAWVIGVEWYDVISRLALHDVKMYSISHPQKVYASGNRITKVSFPSSSYEGHFRPTYVEESVDTCLTIDHQYIIIPSKQSAVRILVQLLTINSDMSFMKWGFFNAIFEQKEYGESYVLEPLSRKMMEDNPALQVEFEALKKEDSAFAADPYAQLNWFYRKSLWRDERMNWYPVFRLMTEKDWEKITPYLMEKK